MANTTIRTPKKRRAVLKALEAGLSVSAACRSAVMSRSAYFDWLANDVEFAADVQAAIDAGTDRLEDIAQSRAEDSSDTLMIFLLKARRPDKYKERQSLEHTGKDGVPLTIVFGERKDGPS